MKIFILLVFGLLLLIYSQMNAITIGLDSGHSNKELYKSGPTFNTRAIINDIPGNYDYYSIAYPAGGLEIVNAASRNSVLMAEEGDTSGSLGSVQRTYVMMVDSIDKF